MTAKQIIILALSIIIIFATSIGFFITLDISAQIAYARLFIDAGLLIGSIAIIMAFYKDKDLPTEGLIHALNSLKNGHYKTRIDTVNFAELSSLAAGINELAEHLDKEHEKQQEIKRSLREELLPSLKQKEMPLIDHSHHPELGPVLRAISLDDDDKTITPHKSIIKKNQDHVLENPLINDSSIKPIPSYKEQNFIELYEQFLSSQPKSIQAIDYNIFLATIMTSKEELIKTHQCHDIWFDIVKDDDEVALQPKIVR